MTEEMIALRALLEKSSDADLLREMIGFTTYRLMQLEVAVLTGAGHGRRWADDLAAFPGTGILVGQFYLALQILANDPLSPRVTGSDASPIEDGLVSSPPLLLRSSPR